MAYRTNIPLDGVRGGKAFAALRFEGQPLAPEHGAPARLVVPHFYFWKSAKWVKALRFMANSEPVSGSRTATACTAIRGSSSGIPRTINLGSTGNGQVRLADRGVTQIMRETPRAKTFTLELPQWQQHRAGQHYDVRLTAEDGYQAQRSYSIASPPEQRGEIELTVDLVPEGEISTYLHENLSMGDPLEVRGPIGGYFVWGQNSRRFRC